MNKKWSVIDWDIEKWLINSGYQKYIKKGFFDHFIEIVIQKVSFST